MGSYKLSILIPTLYSRIEKFNAMVHKIMKQVEDNELTSHIEIISHFDNKSVGLSKKRTDMLRNANGDFVTFLDDDDDISDDYIKLIYDSIVKNPDTHVITFNQHCNCDGRVFFVQCDIGHDLTLNRTASQQVYTRYPWIWCVWKRELVCQTPFSDPDPNKKNYAEDSHWITNIKDKIKNETKISALLHFYRYSSAGTETQNFNQNR